jgi:nicotinamide-nucleotide amidase
MYGEIITIGNELTSGRTRDLNAWYAAGKLTASGLRVLKITSVGDDMERVTQALVSAIDSSRFVIVTGGLGSTDDDMTCTIAAKALDRPLCLDEGLFRAIKTYVEMRGIAMTPALEKMAWMPEGSRIISPKAGMCGFSLVEKGVRIYFLPGVPEQMRYLMDRFVLPEIISDYKDLPHVKQRTLKVFGMSEPAIAEAFKRLKGRTGEAIIGFYPRFPENHITITLRGTDRDFIEEEVGRIDSEIGEILGPCLFARDSQTMEEVVGGLLSEKGLTLSVAESCTGGLLGKRITNVAGSSTYFLGGVIAYSNELKINLLKVDRDVISTAGAVSREAAVQMAEGVKALTNSDLAVAVTGIAGPDGGSTEKPVGTVHIGMSWAGGACSGMYRFSGGRDQVRSASAAMALDWIRRHLSGYSFLPGF